MVHVTMFEILVILTYILLKTDYSKTDTDGLAMTITFRYHNFFSAEEYYS